MKVDPYTYGTVKTKHEAWSMPVLHARVGRWNRLVELETVHATGEIWAAMLIEVYAALVKKYG